MALKVVEKASCSDHLQSPLSNPTRVPCHQPRHKDEGTIRGLCMPSQYSVPREQPCCSFMDGSILVDGWWIARMRTRCRSGWFRDNALECDALVYSKRNDLFTYLRRRKYIKIISWEVPKSIFVAVLEILKTFWIWRWERKSSLSQTAGTNIGIENCTTSFSLPRKSQCDILKPFQPETRRFLCSRPFHYRFLRRLPPGNAHPNNNSVCTTAAKG